MDRSLVKNAVFNIAYKLMNVLFPLITSAYVSRVLLSDRIGKVAYAQTIASIFVIVAALGLPAYGIKVIASLKNKGDEEARNKIFSELWLILIASTLICCIVYISLVFTIPVFYENRVLFFVAGIQIVLVSCNVDWLYQGLEDYGYIAIRSFAVKLVSLACIFVFVRNRDDYIIYALITSLAVAGNNIWNVLHSRKYVRFTLNNISIRKHLKPVVILLLSTLAIELYSKVDITMLGIMCEDRNVGYYSNAIKVINAIVTALTAITTVFLPRLSKHILDDKGKYDVLVNQGVKILICLSVPCCIGLIIVANDFAVTMFGEGFFRTGNSLKILAPLLIIKGVGDLLNYQVIISAGKEKYFLITNFSAAISNLILNYLFIPIYQEMGAAIASVISELVVNVGMFFVSRSIVRVKLSHDFMITELISLIVMTVGVYIVNSMSLGVGIRLLLSIGTGILLYFILNLLLKNDIFLMIINGIRNRERQ